MLRSCVMADDQDEQTLDLTIEALTGTVYDLCVSPYETILGIKMKIQNLEGKSCSCLCQTVVENKQSLS